MEERSGDRGRKERELPVLSFWGSEGERARDKES
jgi:hypothetical protein